MSGTDFGCKIQSYLSSEVGDVDSDCYVGYFYL